MALIRPSALSNARLRQSKVTMFFFSFLQSLNASVMQELAPKYCTRQTNSWSGEKVSRAEETKEALLFRHIASLKIHLHGEVITE